MKEVEKNNENMQEVEKIEKVKKFENYKTIYETLKEAVDANLKKNGLIQSKSIETYIKSVKSYIDRYNELKKGKAETVTQKNIEDLQNKIQNNILLMDKISDMFEEYIDNPKLEKDLKGKDELVLLLTKKGIKLEENKLTITDKEKKILEEINEELIKTNKDLNKQKKDLENTKNSQDKEAKEREESFNDIFYSELYSNRAKIKEAIIGIQENILSKISGNTNSIIGKSKDNLENFQKTILGLNETINHLEDSNKNISEEESESTDTSLINTNRIKANQEKINKIIERNKFIMNGGTVKDENGKELTVEDKNKEKHTKSDGILNVVNKINITDTKKFFEAFDLKELNLNIENEQDKKYIETVIEGIQKSKTIQGILKDFNKPSYFLNNNERKKLGVALLAKMLAKSSDSSHGSTAYQFYGEERVNERKILRHITKKCQNNIYAEEIFIDAYDKQNTMDGKDVKFDKVKYEKTTLKGLMYNIRNWFVSVFTKKAKKTTQQNQTQQQVQEEQIVQQEQNNVQKQVQEEQNNVQEEQNKNDTIKLNFKEESDKQLNIVDSGDKNKAICYIGDENKDTESTLLKKAKQPSEIFSDNSVNNCSIACLKESKEKQTIYIFAKNMSGKLLVTLDDDTKLMVSYNLEKPNKVEVENEEGKEYEYQNLFDIRIASGINVAKQFEKELEQKDQQTQDIQQQ